MDTHCGPYACGPALIRRHPTKDERIVRLKEYQEALEHELQGVKERIDSIQKS